MKISAKCDQSTTHIMEKTVVGHRPPGVLEKELLGVRSKLGPTFLACACLFWLQRAPTYPVAATSLGWEQDSGYGARMVTPILQKTEPQKAGICHLCSQAA
jgi:hypothetical protein